MPREPQPLTPQDAAAMLASGEAVLVDVRDAAAFAEGRPAPARNVPLGELPARAAALAATAPVVITSCGGGTRGPKAARLLAELGIDARPLAGGLRAWRSAGLEVTEL